VATDHLGVQPRSGHLVGRFEVVEEAALHGQHKPAALPLPAVQRQRVQAAAVPAPLLQPASLQVVTQRWQLALQMSGTSGQSGGRQGVSAGWDGRVGRQNAYPTGATTSDHTPTWQNAGLSASTGAGLEAAQRAARKTAAQYAARRRSTAGSREQGAQQRPYRRRLPADG
jgi:hypothetical protein